MTTFAVTVDCPDCGGQLTTTATRGGPRQRQADTHCTGCAGRWTITVTLKPHRTPLHAASGPGPRLSYRPLGGRFANDTKAAKALATNNRTIAAWRTDGVPIDDADTVAHRLGLHPVEIWGGAWHTATAVDADQVA